MAAKPLVLFDLVATLTDAGPRYAQAYVRMCQAWNMPVPDVEDILEALGEMNLKQIIAKFSPGLPAEHLSKFMSDCNQSCDAILGDKSWHEELFPNVREALIALRSEGAVLGIYTGTRESALHAQLAYHNLERAFDAGYTRAKDNVRDDGKASIELKSGQIRDMAAQYAAQNGAAAGPVIVIGDSPADMQAAMNAGAQFIAYAHTPKSAEKMRTAGAAHIFSDFEQLPLIVERILRAQPHNQPRSGGIQPFSPMDRA